MQSERAHRRLLRCARPKMLWHHREQRRNSAVPCGDAYAYASFSWVPVNAFASTDVHC